MARFARYRVMVRAALSGCPGRVALPQGMVLLGAGAEMQLGNRPAGRMSGAGTVSESGEKNDRVRVPSACQ